MRSFEVRQIIAIVGYRSRDQRSCGVGYATCTMGRETSERQVKSATRNRWSFPLTNETLRGRAPSSRTLMIAIGVTDSHAFLRQGQQLRGELIRGVCRTFNTKDSRHDYATDRKHTSKEESITPAPRCNN